MGRRHLSRAAALVSGLVLLAAAPAAAAVQWRLLAGGAARGPSVEAPKGYLALSRDATSAFAVRLGPVATSKLARVDFSRQAVVAIVGEFGCRDALVEVASLAQRGQVLAAKLLERTPPPGTVQCLALFPTYRLISVSRSSLVRPYPTRVAVSVARA
jgi:hypothetical protein